MKYAFIQQQGANHAITTLCRVLAVSPSGYYDWLGRPESSRARETRQLVHKIAACHRASRATYGSPRIHQDLVAMGERVSVNRVARLMSQNGIQSRMARSCRPIDESEWHPVQDGQEVRDHYRFEKHGAAGARSLETEL